TETFPSMIKTAKKAQLSTIKAVSGAYPLRGAVRTDPPQPGAPRSGEAWGDARLLAALGVEPGDSIVVGHARLRLAAAVAREPDAAGDFASFIPRLLISEDDLPATGLVQQGSRVRYRLLVAGDRRALDSFRAFVKQRVGRGQRVEDVRDARPEVRVSLERSERFLNLAALVSVFLAAAALGLAARRYTERRLDAAALLRTLGLAQREILSLF